MATKSFCSAQWGLRQYFCSVLAIELRKTNISQSVDSASLYRVFKLPSLLLQRVGRATAAKKCAKHLARRLGLWKGGNLTELLDESDTIQPGCTGRSGHRGLL